MSLVKGDNFVLRIFDGGTWKLYVCGRSISMSIETETIETTVTGSGNYKTFEPTIHSFTGSADGLISLNEAGSLTLPELQALQLAKTKILCRFTQTSQDGDIYTKECYFYITNSTDTGSFDGVASFAVSLKGTGGITQVYTLPPPTTGIMYRYPTMGNTAPPVTGTQVWTAVGLANKDIINVVKDGRGSSNIILSGTPVGNEVLYETTGADGVFTWAFTFEDGETPPYIEYQNT